MRPLQGRGANVPFSGGVAPGYLIAPLQGSGCQHWSVLPQPAKPGFPIPTFALRQNHTPASRARQIQFDMASGEAWMRSFGVMSERSADLFCRSAAFPCQQETSRGRTKQVRATRFCPPCGLAGGTQCGSSGPLPQRSSPSGTKELRRFVVTHQCFNVASF